MTDITRITDEIRDALGADAGLGKSIKIDLGEAGQIYIDGVSEPNTVTNEDKPADATLSLSLSDFQALSSGALDPMMAFMQGKLKVTGDMSLAQRLTHLLKR